MKTFKIKVVVYETIIEKAESKMEVWNIILKDSYYHFGNKLYDITSIEEITTND